MIVLNNNLSSKGDKVRLNRVDTQDRVVTNWLQERGSYTCIR